MKVIINFSFSLDVRKKIDNCEIRKLWSKLAGHVLESLLLVRWPRKYLLETTSDEVEEQTDDFLNTSLLVDYCWENKRQKKKKRHHWFLEQEN